MPYTTRSDALGVQCPNCGADAGDKCIGARGAQRESVHRERMNLAAATLGHSAVRTLQMSGDKLLDADGTVVAKVLGMEIDIQSEELWGNLRRGGKEAAVDVPLDLHQRKNSLGNESRENQKLQTQTELLADPVNETFELYVKLLERPRSQLSGKVRKWIADAHKACGVEQTQLAIRGLAASRFHRERGFVGIEYAIRPKANETVEGRIAMMAAQAPTSGNDPTTVQTLIARLPSDVHGMVYDWIRDVEAMLRNPSNNALSLTGEGRLLELRDKAGMDPIIEDGQIVGWRDLRAPQAP